MCKLTVSINKLNIRSPKVTARIRQDRSRMPSQTWSAGGYCKNISEAVRRQTYRLSKCDRAAGSERRKSRKARRRRPPSSSQGKSATQRKCQNRFGQRVSGSFSTFSALQEKNKKQQHKPKFCPVKPQGHQTGFPGLYWLYDRDGNTTTEQIGSFFFFFL